MTVPLLDDAGRLTRQSSETVAAIREQVGTGRVICGLSGGVDSAVAAALMMTTAYPNPKTRRRMALRKKETALRNDDPDRDARRTRHRSNCKHVILAVSL